MWTPELQTALNALAIALISGVLYVLKPKLDEINKNSRVIKHEITHNTGTSTKDAVTRTENETKFQSNMLREIQKDIGGIREEQRTLHRALESMRDQKSEDHREMNMRLVRLERKES